MNDNEQIITKLLIYNLLPQEENFECKLLLNDKIISIKSSYIKKIYVKNENNFQ